MEHICSPRHNSFSIFPGPAISVRASRHEPGSPNLRQRDEYGPAAQHSARKLFSPLQETDAQALRCESELSREVDSLGLAIGPNQRRNQNRNHGFLARIPKTLAKFRALVDHESCGTRVDCQIAVASERSFGPTTQ